MIGNSRQERYRTYREELLLSGSCKADTQEKRKKKQTSNVRGRDNRKKRKKKQLKHR